MIQRTGEVVIRMLADVKQKTIAPLIRGTIAPGSTVYTDEYDIYARLPEWGYAHRTVCHASGDRCTWGSSSSCTTCGGGARPSSDHSSDWLCAENSPEPQSIGTRRAFYEQTITRDILSIYLPGRTRCDLGTCAVFRLCRC